jgi:myxalamid-type polyketide synthase MxaB
MAGMPPLRGLIHSAGVLDDAVLVRQSPERFRKVMRPKADGAWNLHRATKSLPLDFFILYSSAASLVGSPGQSNYAAANAFLDALAHYRRALGLPGLSINWGAWASGGMASAEPTRARMEARGVSAIPAEAGARLLRNLLYATAARIGVLPVDWRLFLEQFPEGPPSLFETLVSETPAAPAPVREQIAALPYNDREGALRGFLHDELAAVLGFDRVMRLPARQGFFDLGMDSLLSLEYLNRVSARLGLKLPATLAFDYPNLQAFGGCLMKMLAAPAEAEGPAGQLDGLSEDELARLLSRELDEGEVHVR